MICPECNTKISEGSKFCKECGRKIDLTCSGCGKTIPPDSKFCLDCGSVLRQPVSPKDIPKIDYQQPQSYTPKHLAEKILTSRSAIEGERKIVTVMFADVAGFSTISEKLDPEEVHVVMDGCFRILLDQVHACEGTVNEFRGDGVMALFGAPIAHEDHAQRACYAALAIQHALIPYGEKLKNDHGIDFKMRIGLNSGSVVVGAIGDDLRMDYTAQGDTANLAARMESSAQPGTVLVAEATYRLVGDAFEFESLGGIPVKGKEKPVAVFRLKDKAFKARARSEREVYSEMVGRDQELDRLELQILKAVNGEGSVVNVVGEAGIGKSRLMAELKKREVVKRVMLLEGRAISMGKNLSFYPVIALLKNWARIRENDGEAAAMNKLQEAIRRVSTEEADEIFPFVATLMGMKLFGKHAERIKGIEGEALEKLIFKNVRELLIRSTEIVPVVIVIEDLHWADTSSLLLIDALYRLSRSQKVVFINVFRPGYWDNEEKTPGNLKDRMTDLSLVELVLQPLDSESSETLINNMLNIKGLDHGVKTRIIGRAGGNPFFIEEVVRALIDEGAVIAKDGGFEVTDKIHTVVIPPTINDVLMARIDRLDEESRNVVKVASVIGRSFFYRILADVISRVEGLDDKLEYLKQIQLIRERMQMNELEYLFKHALAQEAAYESTLLQQRKQLHLKVAESIERLFSERLHEFYGILALHYSRADNLEKAEEYIVKAGEEAVKSSTSSEALQYYRNALEIYMTKYKGDIDHIKIAGIEENIANAYYRRGLMAESVDYYDRCIGHLGIKEYKNRGIQLFQVIVNLLKILRCLYLPSVKKKKVPGPFDMQISNIIFNRGFALVYTDPERFVIDNIIIASRIFQLELTDFKSGALLIAGTSGMFSFAGISFSISRKILNYIGNNIDLKNTDTCHNYFLYELVHNFLSGSWITEYDTVSLEYCLKIGDIMTASGYLCCIGWIYAESGNIVRAAEVAEKLKVMGDEYNDKTSVGQYYEVLFHLYLKKRVLTGVSEILERGVEVLKRLEQAGRTISLMGLKLRIEILGNDLVMAEKTLREAATLIAMEKNIIPLYYGNYLLGAFMYNLAGLEAALRKNDHAAIKLYSGEAMNTGKKAVAISKKVALHKTEAYRLMGTCHVLLRKTGKALRWWKKAIDEGTRLGARPEVARTYFEVGKRSPAQSKKIIGLTPEECLDKAEALFREMDLEWDLEQLERVRAGA